MKQGNLQSRLLEWSHSHSATEAANSQENVETAGSQAATGNHKPRGRDETEGWDFYQEINRMSQKHAGSATVGPIPNRPLSPPNHSPSVSASATLLVVLNQVMRSVYGLLNPEVVSLHRCRLMAVLAGSASGEWRRKQYTNGSYVFLLCPVELFSPAPLSCWQTKSPDLWKFRYVAVVTKNWYN